MSDLNVKRIMRRRRAQPAATGTGLGERARRLSPRSGALVILGAIGWVLKSADIGVSSSGDPAQPTVSFVAQERFERRGYHAVAVGRGRA